VPARGYSPRIVRRPAAAPKSAATFVGALGLLAGCMPRLPQDSTHRALVRDVARVVDVRSRVGWFIDESELEAVLPYAMKAACQTTAASRTASLRWLDQEIDAQGGDVAAAWRERNQELDKVEELLLLTRTRLVLARADDWVRHGRCPFWLEPTARFRGVHTQGHRLILTLEGGGRATQELSLGAVKYGGGGSGRLIVAYGIAESWALGVGAEVGGSARFTNLQLGQQSDLPELVGLVVAPVVLRWHFGLTAHAEIEAGPMAYIDRGSADPTTGRVEAHFDRGIHFGVAIGATYLRLQRGVIPKFAVSLTVDYVPGVDGQPGLTQIGVGARTGIDLSRWKRF
jgi:hypothetical protein